MLKHYIDVYLTLSLVSQSGRAKKQLSRVRCAALKEMFPMVKVAFDTRRINQETTYLPRRNLQNYQRSEPFITAATGERVKNFFKVKTAVDELARDFANDPIWLDSYARVLSGTLDRTLRIDQKDYDFSVPQLDYLQELLYLRYRIKPEDIVKLNELELKNIILNKDEKLVYKNIYAKYEPAMVTTSIPRPEFRSEADFVKTRQDDLMEKLFGSVKASKDNKEVQRSVTITINDKVIEAPVEKPEVKVVESSSSVEIDDNLVK